ncbi:MAG: hypothetical protein Q8R36_03380, partial [bacterium]|nr:hypothetical protein [bacterium]
AIIMCLIVAVPLFMILVCYFISCDPLPPSNERSRLQKWAVSLKEKIVFIPSPTPVPASWWGFFLPLRSTVNVRSFS